MGSVPLRSIRPLADHSGFDKFYGFIGGETNQWAPAIFDGTVRVEPPHDPNYHFTVDMTNQAIGWMQAQHALTPDRPFFLYFATGATHAPHHVPKEYIDRYKGQFDRGWDALRSETFARQKKMGVIPKNAELTKRPSQIPAWDSQTPEQKQIEARQMETFAGFAEQTDEQVGRLIDGTRYDGCAGQHPRRLHRRRQRCQRRRRPGRHVQRNDGAERDRRHRRDQCAASRALGRPDHVSTLRNRLGLGRRYAVSMDQADRIPLRRHDERRRDSLAGRYQGDGGAIRSQFTYVTDIAPTVLEAAKLPFPKSVNGTTQLPFDGTSMAYSFDDPKAKETHTTQYFEMFGNRGIYHDGWTASTRHSIPWLLVQNPPLENDVWELYNVANDFSQAHDLATKNPPS